MICGPSVAASAADCESYSSKRVPFGTGGPASTSGVENATGAASSEAIPPPPPIDSPAPESCTFSPPARQKRVLWRT